jgi:taurine--2-oxoglutarate transaminase
MFYCGLTYYGHPLSCATAIATIEVYKEDKLIENAHALGKILKSETENLKENIHLLEMSESLDSFPVLKWLRIERPKNP